MRRTLTESAFRILTCAAVCLAVLLAYWQSFSGEFVWDDASSVQTHKHVQDPAKFFQLFREDQHAFGRGQGNFYRPLLAASFMVDYILSRPERPMDVSPLLFHVTSTAWHALAAVLLFALLTRLQAPRFVRAAVPLLYAVHPLHTEAVAYISGRADPMSAAFMFAGLWFALWRPRSGSAVPGTLLSGLCFAAGLLCKESAFIFPALVLWFIVAVPRTTDGDDDAPATFPKPYPALVVSGVLLAIYAILRLKVLNFGSDTVARTASWWQRLVEVGQAFALYIRLLFVPTGLHMERSLDNEPWWLAGVGVVLLAGCVVLTIRTVRTRHYRVAVGMGWFLITWLPISGIFPLNAPMAEHWLYVPMAGFIWVLAELAWAAGTSARYRRTLVVAAYAVCVCFIAMTVARNQAWRSNEALFRATLEKNPNSTRIHYNLAVWYEDLLDNQPGARRHYEKVLDLHRARRNNADTEDERQARYADELDSHLALSRIYFAQERYDLAAQHAAELLAIGPTDENRPMRGQAAVTVAQCYLAMGQVEPAKKLFDEAVKILPQLKPQVDAMLRGMGMQPST